jgi:hypothetical protein
MATSTIGRRGSVVVPGTSRVIRERALRNDESVCVSVARRRRRISRSSTVQFHSWRTPPDYRVWSTRTGRPVELLTGITMITVSFVRHGESTDNLVRRLLSLPIDTKV